MERQPDAAGGGYAASHARDLAGMVLSFERDVTPVLSYAGGGCARLTGYPASWLLGAGDRFWDLFEAGVRDRLRAFVAAPRSEPETVLVRLLHRDGHTVPVEFCMLPSVATSPDGATVDGWMVEAGRGTREERAAARLLGAIAEVLRGPIGALTVASTTLARSDVDLSEQQRRSALQIIDRAGRRVAAPLVRMLELAQLRQRPLAPREPVRLVELVERVVDEETAAGTMRVEVTGDPTQEATVERASLATAIREILRNALDHADEHVFIHVATSAGAATVEIADDGPGVPVELLPRLFEPFAAGPGAIQRGTRTGLGLAIATAAARRSGGSLEHRPRRPSGEVFALRLPTPSSEAPAAAAPNVRVVLLAAERLTADAVVRTLAQAPRIAEVVAVAEVEAAESAATQIRADVVIVDLDRVGGDAFAAAQRIRASAPSSRLLLVGTALSLRDLAAAVDVGAAGLVPKELGLAALVEAAGRVTHEQAFVDASTLLELTRRGGSAELEDGFTDREKDVLQLMAQGFDTARIAKELGLQVSTCRGYIKSILAKLQAHTQLEAVVLASRRGLVRIPGADRSDPHWGGDGDTSARGG